MTHRRLFLSLIASVSLIAMGACAADPGYTVADFAKVKKFDSHVHVNVTDPAFVDQAKADGFELLSINVDYPEFPALADQAAVAHHFHDADPSHFHYATAFTMKGFTAPGWAERTNAWLDSEFKQGAVAVKIWKNVGLIERDTDGKLIFIDDPRFDPVVAHIIAAGKVIINHQGEPKNCWLPMDEMSTDNDREYFSHHPEYYMYLHPEMPSYEALMATRDRFVANHPDLKFVGAHFASLEWSVDEAAKFLDAYPNANIELAARITQVQSQSVKDYDKVRNFFITYQDRIMYGTDLTLNPGDDPAEFKAEAHTYWLSDWTYLATGETRHVDDIHADAKGLALPKEVIDKIYYNNAKREYLN
ncbi:amidohydrolase family protein [Asticcacaulis sp.]|uniref:amidohydrolase family protein n=1 Tax=Asticcacaulis sp. TaxID=1872648 RepID=UPI002C653435|nr:amidohydrolase family protein [Asticcacaulis sp.]HTM79836.1 amidohydrolase family protein [Asticcacaulis sp.]